MKTIFEKISLFLYLFSIVVFFANASLLMLNGHVRDDYNIAGSQTLNTSTLFLAMAAAVLVFVVLLFARFFGKYSIRAELIGLCIVIPLFLFAVVVVVINVIQLREIYDAYAITRAVW